MKKNISSSTLKTMLFVAVTAAMAICSITSPSTLKTMLFIAGTAAMAIYSIASNFISSKLCSYVITIISDTYWHFSEKMTIVIEEHEGFTKNQTYEDVKSYLETKISPSSHTFNVTGSDDNNNTLFSLAMECNQSLIDVFNGIKFSWTLVYEDLELKSLNLTFHMKHETMALETYLPYVIKKGKSIKQEKKVLKRFSLECHAKFGNPNDVWVGVDLDHPATFETLAMEPHDKEFVMKDLERFVKRKEYYKKVGKAWKRGYLFYGPPDIDKSSLIAAMANYLRFDVYELELTDLELNSEFRKLLTSISTRSILVVEDIDCTIDFHDLTDTRAYNRYNHRKQITLSRLLKFVDGLWSSWGDERIIVFTTNHKEKIDPALLRPGFMDVHINMSYCTPSCFEHLASNYLGIKQHSLFKDVKEALQQTQVTPAEVTEQLLESSHMETSLTQLLDFLVEKKASQELEAKRKEQEAVDNKRKEQQAGDNKDGTTKGKNRKQKRTKVKNRKEEIEHEANKDSSHEEYWEVI